MRCDGLEGASGHSIDPSLLVLVVVVNRNEEGHASWWAHEGGEWKSGQILTSTYIHPTYEYYILGVLYPCKYEVCTDGQTTRPEQRRRSEGLMITGLPRLQRATGASRPMAGSAIAGETDIHRLSPWPGYHDTTGLTPRTMTI